MTNPPATSRQRRAPLALALLLAACAGGPERAEPGRLDEARLAQCRAVAQAWVDGSPEYPALRDALRDDPAAFGWFVRYLEAVLVTAREGRAEVTDRQTLVAQPGGRRDLGPEIADVANAVRAGSGSDEWPRDEDRADTRAVAEIAALGAQAVPIVVGDLVRSPQEFLQTIGIELVARIGDPAVPELLELARRGAPAEQRTAARALGEIGATGAALDALRELSRSSDWTVRSDAAQALHKGGPEARALLIAMLGDDDPFVRRMAAATLGKYRDAVAAGALADFLERSLQREDLAGERAAQLALQAMASARGPRTVAAWRTFAARLAAEAPR